MRSKLFFAFLALIVIVGCNPQPLPIPNNQDVSVINIFGGTNPNSPTGTDCLPVDRVRIVEFPTALAVNDSARIDVTPKDTFGNNRSDACNEKDGNRWDSNEEICIVGDDNAFVTTIKGIKIGTCEITANVSGKTDSVKFPVN